MDTPLPSYSLHQLCELVEGQLVGPGDTPITAALPLQDAQPGCLSLVDSEKKIALAEASSAAALLLEEASPDCSKPMLVADEPHAAFQKIIRWMRPSRVPQAAAIADSASIDPTVTLGAEVSIGAGVTIAADCVIGDRCQLYPGVHLLPGCQVGNDCTLFPGVVLYEDTRLGNNVLLHANVVLGAYGFGYRQQADCHVRSAQLGWVEIGDDVEVGAGTTIDRGTYGASRIGRGTKIDNQVQVGHNCHIGQDNLICAQVGIAGSCSTGRHVILAGQVGLADHVKLSDHVTVAAQSGVMADLKEETVVMGSPAAPIKQHLREYALIARLPELRRELKVLKNQVAVLEQHNAEVASEPASSDSSTSRASTSSPTEQSSADDGDQARAA